MITNNENKKRVKLVEEIKKQYGTNIKDSIMDTRVYESTDVIASIRGPRDTEIIFEEMDSVSAVLKYADQRGTTAILNFANFTTPGGGFIYGAMAQEEALCMESTLYPVISDIEFASYYEQNIRALSGLGHLYSNRALYSPDITFFRGNEWKYCDVITCAAPNASAYLASGGSQSVNYYALLDRVQFVLNIAEKNGIDTLILGAFGCGVFGQTPETLGSLCKRLIEEKYKGVFERVVFAVIDEKTLKRLETGYREGM